MYQKHPSEELNRLFRQRPFQGVQPECSRFLFVGLDANYAAGIEDSAAFPALVEYHQDGVAFWRRHGVHHPFLLPAYRGDGRRYHLNFARIGFAPDDADKVSFVELLHVPSVGRSSLEVEDFDEVHLAWLNELMTAGVPRKVFVSAGVLRLLIATRRFAWLRSAATGAGDLLPVLHASGGTQIHLHLHFSNYGKFQARMDLEAAAIRQLATGKAAWKG